MEHPNPKYAVVLDFEATCDERISPSPQEVIEFPSVLLEPGRGVLATFESFVRPVHHPKLSKFCTNLTSITTAEVASAPEFTEVFAQHQRWMQSHGLSADNAVIVTCGDWDLHRMLPKQLEVAEIVDIPKIYSRWLNVKVPFKEQFPRARAGMESMLEMLGLPLLGRHHRGIDDCHNITAILDVLLRNGASLRPTGAWKAPAWPALPLVLEAEGQSHPVRLKPRTLDRLRGHVGHLFQARARSLSVEGRRLTAPELLELPAHTVVRVELSH